MTDVEQTWPQVFQIFFQGDTGSYDGSDSNQRKCDSYTWLCSQFLGSSLALRFLRLRRALDGLEKPRSDSWLLLPSLELLLEVELEQDRAVWAGRGDTEPAVGGWQAHRKRRVESLASRERVRGRKWPEEEEVSGDHAWRKQGLALAGLSPSEVRLALEERRPGVRWQRGLRGCRLCRRGLGEWGGRCLRFRGVLGGSSANRDIQWGGESSWVLSSNSSIRRARMSVTVPMSSEASITVTEEKQGPQWKPVSKKKKRLLEQHHQSIYSRLMLNLHTHARTSS